MSVEPTRRRPPRPRERRPSSPRPSNADSKARNSAQGHGHWRGMGDRGRARSCAATRSPTGAPVARTTWRWALGGVSPRREPATSPPIVYALRPGVLPARPRLIYHLPPPCSGRGPRSWAGVVRLPSRPSNAMETTSLCKADRGSTNRRSLLVISSQPDYGEQALERSPNMLVCASGAPVDSRSRKNHRLPSGRAPTRARGARVSMGRPYPSGPRPRE